MSSRATIRFVSSVLTLLAVLLAAQGAGAQTVLLVVVEQANSRPLAPPLAVREGVSAGLFDAGCIVLDAPGSTALPAAGDAARLARSAGAEVALEIVTDYADTSLGRDLLRISARTTYTLIDTATSRDREKDVNRAALGAEIGRDIVREVKDVLDRRPRAGE
jgi:hypothetical protein